MIRFFSFKTTGLELMLAADDEALLLCDRVESAKTNLARLEKALGRSAEEGSNPVLDDAVALLERYFAGESVELSTPVRPIGTEFQRTVWSALRRVPRGQAASYGALARALGRPKAARAVGGAVGANPILLFIPCHRVLASNGALGGFSAGLDLKRRLLALEGIRWKER